MEARFSRKNTSLFTVPIRFHIHILKHFSELDKSYKDWLKNQRLISDKDITKLLQDRYASKFDKAFVTNPDKLITYIKEKINSSRKKEFVFIKNRCEIQFRFSKVKYSQGIGTDNIIKISETNKKSKLTWLLNVILLQKEGQIEIITAFTGKYAPPLPDVKQDKESFEKSKLFWGNYTLL